MKKIVLNVEALEVVSFVAQPGESGARGTVHGHVTALRCNSMACETYFCSINYPTCDQASCPGTCGYPYQPQC